MALVGGLIPIFSTMKNNSALLHRATGIAAGILLASALLVATVDTLPDIHNPETGTRAMVDVFIGALILSVILVLAITSGLIEHGH